MKIHKNLQKLVESEYKNEYDKQNIYNLSFYALTTLHSKKTLPRLYLRKKYGYKYAQYIEFMIRHNYIILTENYSTKSHKANEYLNICFDTEELIDNRVDTNEISKYSVAEKQAYRRLKNTKIDIDAISDEKLKIVADVANSNLTNIINRKTKNRLYTTFSNLNSEIRKNAKLNNRDLVEIDLSASIYLQLYKIITDKKYVKKHKLYHSEEQLKLIDKITDEELHEYKNAICNDFYSSFTDENITRNEVKESAMYLMFLKNDSIHRKTGVVMKKLANRFKNIHNLLKSYRRVNGNASYLANTLFQIESNIIIDKIHSKYECLTCHDAVYCYAEDVEAIKQIIYDFYNADVKIKINSSRDLVNRVAGIASPATTTMIINDKNGDENEKNKANTYRPIHSISDISKNIFIKTALCL